MTIQKTALATEIDTYLSALKHGKKGLLRLGSEEEKKSVCFVPKKEGLIPYIQYLWRELCYRMDWGAFSTKKIELRIKKELNTLPERQQKRILDRFRSAEAESCIPEKTRTIFANISQAFPTLQEREPSINIGKKTNQPKKRLVIRTRQEQQQDFKSRQGIIEGINLKKPGPERPNESVSQARGAFAPGKFDKVIRLRKKFSGNSSPLTPDDIEEIRKKAFEEIDQVVNQQKISELEPGKSLSFSITTEKPAKIKFSIIKSRKGKIDVIASGILLGSGTFKKVKIGFSLTKGQFLALASSAQNIQGQNAWHEEIKTELNISNALKEKKVPNVIRLKKITHKGKERLISKLYNIGDMNAFVETLKNLKEITYTFPNLAKEALKDPHVATKMKVVTLLQAALGLKGMHDAGFVHLDIKPANILVNWNSEDKKIETAIADFGFVHELATAIQYREVVTAAYRAPELSRPQGMAALASADVFAFGATIYEIMQGELLFDPSPPSEKQAEEKFQQLSTDRGASNLLFRLVAGCINPDLKSRIPMSMVMQQLHRILTALEAPNASA